MIITQASMADFDGIRALLRANHADYINQINGRSYAAHTRKVPMTTAGTFDFNHNHYYLMACSTALAEGASIRMAELRDIPAIADTYTPLLSYEQTNGDHSY